MSVRFLDFEFWEKAYLAALCAGKRPHQAKLDADEAMIHWQAAHDKRWKDWKQ